MALDRNWGFWAGRFLTKLEVLRLRLRLVVGVLTVSSQLRRRMLPYCPPDGAVYQYMPPHTVAPDTEGSTCRRAWHRSTAWSIHRMANRQSTYQSESTTECQTWLAWRYVCRARTNDNERRAGTNGHSCTWVTMRVLRSHCTGMRARIRPTRSIPTAACFSGCLWVPRSKAISGMHLSSFGRALSSRQHGTGPCISCSPQK
jgi:hypothetical protein